MVELVTVFYYKIESFEVWSDTALNTCTLQAGSQQTWFDVRVT